MPAPNGILPPVRSAARSAERELLAGGCAMLGLHPTAGQIERLLALIDALEAATALFNLTAIRDRPGMLRKHVLDSLTLQPFLAGHSLADVGTGAGFPGLPLAIVNPGLRFALIESVGKKARFVDATARALACHNVEVIHERAERYRPAAPFDRIASRALGSLAAFAAVAAPLCAAGGRLLAMKGRRPEEEIAALPADVRLIGVHRVRVPGLDDERHIVELCPTGRRPAPATGARRGEP
jgi:16S rRNA (guanine527-N7)-methyltransferase